MKSFLLTIILTLVLCGPASADWSTWTWGDWSWVGSNNTCVIDDNAVLYDDNCLWEITF